MKNFFLNFYLNQSRSQATIFGSSIININHLVSAVTGVGVKCDTWENKRKANPLAAPPGYLDQDTTEFQKKGKHHMFLNKMH